MLESFWKNHSLADPLSYPPPASGPYSITAYRGALGLNPEVIAEITKRYGFDKPIHERYFTLL